MAIHYIITQYVIFTSNYTLHQPIDDKAPVSHTCMQHIRDRLIIKLSHHTEKRNSTFQFPKIKHAFFKIKLK